MKVVALLSGGKDSCFNLLECLANGHEPIAVGGLLPTAGVDELDSFMFQTVGLSLLPLIARSLRLPLYTRVITGKAVTLAGEYGSRRGMLDREEQDQEGGEGGGVEGDETEDLYELLTKVKAAHPDVQAVSVGAILSSYQRVRVEQVCARLGLTPLAYMWQSPQSSLLAQILNSGMSCVLVKVAGVGLTEPDLGQTLGALEGKLRRLNERFGLHLCGEGGEYETVTVDSPLFHERISLDETAITTVDASPVAPVAHLRILKASLVDKEGYIPLTQEGARKLLDHGLVAAAAAAAPCAEDDEEEEDEVTGAGEQQKEPFMDPQAVAIRSAVERAMTQVEPAVKGLTLAGEGSWAIERCSGLEKAERDGWVCVGGVNGLGAGEKERSLEDEVHWLFKNLRTALHPHPLTSIQSISLFLSSMALFPSVNAIYKQYFGTSPPTRACVATLLPAGERARVEAVAFVGREGEKRNVDGEVGGRRGLHVQSLSHWAPANIGPYSQAVIVDNRLALAGQIPLIPASLTLPTPSSFPTEVALSLKHVRSIWAALKDSTGGSELEGSFVEGCICWIDPKAWGGGGLEGAKEGWRAWLAKNDQPSTAMHSPPVLFVAPVGLPRGALVEWQVAFHTGQSTGMSAAADDGASSASDDDGDDGEAAAAAGVGSVEQPSERFATGSVEGGRIAWRTSAFPTGTGGSAHWGVAGVQGLNALASPSLLAAIPALRTAYSLKVFHQPSLAMRDLRRALEPISNQAHRPAITFVAVEHIALSAGGELSVGLVWQGIS